MWSSIHQQKSMFRASKRMLLNQASPDLQRTSIFMRTSIPHRMLFNQASAIPVPFAITTIFRIYLRMMLQRSAPGRASAIL